MTNSVATPDEPRSPVADFLRHAGFHARDGQSGIGAAVTGSVLRDGERIWDAVVTDGREWHYVRVLATGMGPFPNLADEVIEEGIDRYAATLPRVNRLGHLLNSNPLHAHPDGEVGD